MQFDQLYLKAKQFLTSMYDHSYQKTERLWEQTKPAVQRLIQAGIALYTSFSAFKSTIESLPIILSCLTILATAPLLSYLMPSLLLNVTVLIIILASISGLVGYSKYRELKQQSELNAQTKLQGQKIDKQEKKINNLGDKIKKLIKQIDELKAEGDLPSTHAESGRYSLRSTEAHQQEQVPHFAANQSSIVPANIRTLP